MPQAFLSILNEVLKVSIKTVLSVIVGFIITALLGGYVVAKLWGWFVVPTFGAPALGIVPAIGIALITGLLTYNVDDYTEPTDDSPSLIEVLSYKIFIAVVVSLACLSAGWLLHFWM